MKLLNLVNRVFLLSVWYAFVLIFKLFILSVYRVGK